MRSVRIAVALAFVLAAVSALAATRTIRIFDKRQIVIAVPEGWKFDLEKDKKTGLQTMHVEDRESDVKLAASFHPDPDKELATEEAIGKRLGEIASDESATFTYVKTVDGVAGHGVVGDATKGMRSWPGVYVAFTVTGDRESEAYAKAIEVITTGMREVAK